MGKKYNMFKVNLEGLDDKARWYTIVTQYNYEQKVANNIKTMIKDKSLNSNIEDVFCCITEEKVSTKNKKGETVLKTKNEKLMSNYVFVKTKMDVHIWSLLTGITGVSAILCVAGIPVSTSDKKIQEIRDML